MRLSLQLALAMTMLTLTHAAHAQGAGGAIHVATYVEVAPASVRQASNLLRQYREAGRKEAGNMRVEVGQEMGRPNRFVVLEIWKDQAAFEQHGKAPGTTEVRDKLKTIHQAPYDERVHNTLSVAANEPINASRAIFVVSHVDVPPPRKDDCIAQLNPLSEASRKSSGNLRFEVVQQTTRPNHFTVIEAWKDRRSYDARGTAEPQRQFRDKLGPMLGALYDERLYRALN